MIIRRPPCAIGASRDSDVVSFSASSGKRKIGGILSVLLVLVVFWIVVWAFGTTSIYTLQEELLYWNYFSHILMIVLAVVAIALTKRSFLSFGFTSRNWRSDIGIAAICLIAAAGFIPSLIYPSIASNEPLNTIFLIAAVLLALFAVSKERSGSETGRPSTKGSPLASIVPLFPVVFLLADINMPLIASTIVFQFFFAGFGEEILFRGYMQPRLNQDFGMPWQFAGVRFGPGLVITSVLFGAMHLLNPFNPFQGQYALAIWSGIYSTFGGFLFGFIREKTGNVLAPSIAHGLVDLGQVIPLLL